MEKKGQETLLGNIRIPFPPESRLSGIERGLKKNERYIYHRNFELAETFNHGRILLHFGAVDQTAVVSINGKLAGEHTGGYHPFTLDVTDLVSAGTNEICVSVTDALDLQLPYGKQSKRRGGMWYTPISGIWQPVWMESVPDHYIRSLKLTPTLHSITIETSGGNIEKTVVIHLPDGPKEYRFQGNSTTIPIDDPILWTPENPHLYFFTLTDGTDEIESYFALRTISVESINQKHYICLNGEPTFFHGLLDQGYYSDGIYLPASPKGFEFDILTMKKLGFNMLRKHIKIELDLFYYFCDKHGMIVFQDMINSGKYHYILDTVLPTIGLKRGIKHHASHMRRSAFEDGLREMTALLYNHPCVCYYTIFNEGWGQYDADRIYREMKKYDPSRIWDSTSGWFIENESDVISEHIYFRKIVLPANTERPVVLSEFGGYSYKIPENSFNLDKTYGYKKFSDREQFEQSLETLYRQDIIPAIENGLCATVLTQVSDVEDETNGLVTYDRQVVKVDQTVMQTLAKDIYDTFAHQFND